MGVTWLLPGGHAVPGAHNHANTVDHSLPGRGLGDAKKPQWDMVFLLIVPSLAVRCEQVFGLTAMWGHPHQAHCLPTLGEAAQKLMLLADESPNWPYAYMQMNDAMAHMPLSSEGHIGIMTDGIPSINACSHLDQLQVWKLLQCRGWVVCPEGLNGGLKALLFNFKDLPLWNVATMDEPTWDPPLIEVDLSRVEPEATNTTLSTTPLSGHWTSTWHHFSLQPTPPGGLGMAAADFPHNLSPHLST